MTMHRNGQNTQAKREEEESCAKLAHNHSPFEQMRSNMQNVYPRTPSRSSLQLHFCSSCTAVSISLKWKHRHKCNIFPISKNFCFCPTIRDHRLQIQYSDSNLYELFYTTDEQSTLDSVIQKLYKMFQKRILSNNSSVFLILQSGMQWIFLGINYLPSQLKTQQ